MNSASGRGSDGVGAWAGVVVVWGIQGAAVEIRIEWKKGFG
jgi:hypothetical protein